MKYSCFEEFLKDRHKEAIVADDATPFDYEDWLCRLDNYQLINYANWYAEVYAKQVR